MHLARRNPDLRAHAELAPVRELGGGISHKDRAIETLEKPRRRGVVFGYDAVRVL